MPKAPNKKKRTITSFTTYPEVLEHIDNIRGYESRSDFIHRMLVTKIYNRDNAEAPLEVWQTEEDNLRDKLELEFARHGPWAPIAVDAVLIEGNTVCLVKRDLEPFKGDWSLPGGFLKYGETAESGIKRVMKDKTGLDVNIVKLVGVFSDPDRDPRGQVISTTYLVEKVNKHSKLKAGPGVESVEMHKIKDTTNLAFDHSMVLSTAQDVMKGGR